MPYASAEEFIAAVGEVEARQVAPGSGTAADPARILEALADASGELDSYIGTRFPTPVTPVPRVLRVHAIAIARSALNRGSNEQMKQAADRARAWARDVSKGLITLGSKEPGETASLPPSSGGPGFVTEPSAFAEGLASWGSR